VPRLELAVEALADARGGLPAAMAVANRYSFIETPKADGPDPCACLRHVFTERPPATRVEDIEALLAHRLEAWRTRQPAHGVVMLNA